MDQLPRATARPIQQEHPPEAGSKDFRNARSHRPDAHLKAYLDGEVSLWRRRLMARHIGKCQSCRKEIQVLEELSRRAQHLDQATPSPRLRARILASLPDAPPMPIVPHLTKSRPTDSLFRRPSLAMGSLCAALLLVVFGSAYALNFWKSAHPYGLRPLASAFQTMPGDPQTTVAKNGAGVNESARTGDSSFVGAPKNDPFAPAALAGTTTPADAVNTAGPGAASNPFTASKTGGMTAEAYTDPISQEAERLAAQPTREKLREKQQQIAADKLSAGASVPRIASIKGRNAAGTQLAFAVANVSEARRQVQKWAEEAGAEMTVLAYTAAKTSAPEGASIHAPEEEAQTPALLKLKVPAQRAESFRSYLSQMGTFVPLKPAGKGIEHVQPSIGAEELSPRMRLPIASALVPDRAVRSENRQTFTVVLRLQPGTLPPH